MAANEASLSESPDPVDAFEDAWVNALESGSEPPSIADFLPPAADPQHPRILKQLVAVDMERRWTDQRPRPESQPNSGASTEEILADTVQFAPKRLLADYVDEFPELLADGMSFELIRAEYQARVLGGEAPNAEEYQARFPEQAKELAALAEELDRELNVGPGRRDPSPLPSIPGYEILGEIGDGGMGVVYKAIQTGLGRTVALKMIQGHVSRRSRERFQIESSAIARFQHPHIVQVFDVGDAGGRPYFSLEFVDGGTLKDKLSGALPAERDAAELVEVMARAVQVAHDHEVIHRDLKPANVLLTKDGVPKIADFGLAKQLDEDAGETRMGDVMGTPSYMAPEQATGAIGEIGPRTDVYGLGAILYETLTGRPPFRAASAIETVEQVKRQEPVSPRQLQPGLSRDLETICLKCLQKDADRRYSTAEQLAHDLRSFLDGKPIQARPVGFLERSWKQCRRNPKLASAITAAVVILLVGITTTSVFAYQSYLNAIAADQNAAGFRQQKLVSDQRLYAADMDRTHQLINKGQIAAALELLDGQTPHRTGGIDLRGWEWYFLYRLCHSELLSLEGHEGGANAVALTKDGSLVATAGKDHQVRIWSAETGHLVRTLSGHHGSVNSLAFADGDGLLISASRDSSVIVWDVASGQVARTYDRHLLPVKGLAASADGLVASASDKGLIRIWDLTTGEDRQVIHAYAAARKALDLAFSPDGKLLVGACQDDGLVVWQVASGQEEFTAAGHASKLAFHPEQPLIAVASLRGHVRVLNLDTGDEVFSFSNAGGVATVAFDPTGQVLASGGGSDSSIALWDAETGNKIRSIAGHRGGIKDVAFSADGSRLASASADGTVKLWDAHQEPGALALRGHKANVGRLTFDSLGRRLLSPSVDYSVRTWDPRSGESLVTFGRHDVELFPGPDGKPGRLRSVRRYEGHTGFVRDADWSSDEKHIVSIGNDPMIRVWDAETGEEIAQIKHGFPMLRGVRWLPQTNVIAVCGDLMDVVLFDVDSGNEVRTVPTSDNSVRKIEFSPDGSLLAISGSDGSVRLHDASTANEVTTFSGFGDAVISLAFDRHSQRLAAGSDDRTIRIWDLETGEQQALLSGHGFRVDSLSFSVDGTRLASTGGQAADRTLKIWNLETQQEVLSIVGPYRHATFSPDGERLACADSDWHTIKVWNAAPVVDRTSHAGKPAKTTDVTRGMPKMKSLGYFVNSVVPVSEAEGKIPLLRAGADKRWVVVVVSIPHRFLIPSEEKYASIKEKAEKNSKRGLPPREQIAIHDPHAVRLFTPENKGVEGVLYSHFPIRAAAGEGFHDDSFTIQHFVPIPPSQRDCFVVGFELDEADSHGPFRVVIGDEPPVEVPEVEFIAPGFSAKRLLLHAWDAVQKDRYTQALDEADLALQQTDQLSGTIFYNAACVYSLASASSLKDESQPDEERNDRADNYAQRAVELLLKAEAQGFADPAHIEKDTDLDALRDRDDFKQFVSELTSSVSEPNASGDAR